MKKEEIIKRYGEAAYDKVRRQSRGWNAKHHEEKKAADRRHHAEHREKEKARSRRWAEVNPDKVRAWSREASCKGGRYYEHQLKYHTIGLQGKRNRIRMKHRTHYRPYKRIIAPDSQIHHEWIPSTANYRGVALVEKDQHQHGFVDVIKILDGKITLLTEEEVKKSKL